MLLEKLSRQLEQFLQEEDAEYFESQKPYALAVSTGVDSMALLKVMKHLFDRLNRSFFVIHINHRLRQESEEEQAYLIQYCQRESIDLVVRIWKHAPLKSNIEGQARWFRYRTFAHVLQEKGSLRLLTAHHADDQVETILMRFLDGYDLSSLQGIQKKSPLYTFPKAQILRPFLTESKLNFYQLVKEEGVTFYEDESNKDVHFKRNRFRQKILPYLEEESPHLREHLSQFSYDLQGILEFAQPAIENFCQEILTLKEGKWALDIESLKSLSDSQQRLALKQVLNKIAPEDFGSFGRRGQEQLLQFLKEGVPQGTFDLPGQWQVDKVYQCAYFYEPGQEASLFKAQVGLLKAGQTYWIDEKWGIAYGKTDLKEADLYLPEELGDQKLLVRHRQAGDYLFLPSGERQKLRRYFINNKWPAKDRQEAWLLVLEDRWVIGILTASGEWKYRYPLFKVKEELSGWKIKSLKRACHNF